MNASLSPFSDADAIASVRRAARLVALLGVVGIFVAWFLAGWQSAALLLVGALISITGLWEWRRLMAALMARMEAAPPTAEQLSENRDPAKSESQQDGLPVSQSRAPSVGFAAAGFFLRFGVVLVVLYASLKYLHGNVIALAAGLGLAVVSLTAEGLRLLRSGTI